MSTKPLRKTRLSGMRLTEVSIVDDGANQAARVSIAKRRDRTRNTGDAHMSTQHFEKFADHEDEDLDLLALEDITEDDIADLLETLEAIDADIEEAGDDIEEEELEGLQKIRKGLAMAAVLLEENAELADAVAEAGEEIAKRDVRLAKRDDQIRKLGAPIEEEEEEEIDLETLSPAIRKQLEDAKATAAEVAKMREKTEREEVKKRVERAGVPNPDSVTNLMLRIQKRQTDAKDADFVLNLLKASGNAARNTELFEKLGDKGGDANTIDVRIAAAVEPILKSNPGISKEQAMAKALEADPALYREYLADRGR